MYHRTAVPAAAAPGAVAAAKDRVCWAPHIEDPSSAVEDNCVVVVVVVYSSGGTTGV